MANDPTEINYPDDIEDGDVPKWEGVGGVEPYFAAIKTALETDKLTDGNLDLDNFELPFENLETIPDEAITYEMIATPGITLGYNASAFTPGDIGLGVETTVATATVPAGAGFYLMICKCQVKNTHSATGPALLTAKLKGSTSGTLVDQKRDWNLSTSYANLYHPFNLDTVANLTPGETISITLTDSATNYTEVAAGGASIALVRLAS